MATSEGFKYENSTEVLDGNVYKACEFTKCRLVYRGGLPPSVSQCRFSDCEWFFEDAADRTVAFMKAIYHGMGEGGRQVIDATFENIRKA
jgi:hypothetical protein